MSAFVALIDYGAGNLRSAANALTLAGAKVQVTDDAQKLAQAERIVLPGVGAFADCMENLQKRPGMVGALEQAVLVEKKPFLGICVGMQLMAKESHEFGVSAGLGWFSASVRRLESQRGKIPHMGWNDIVCDYVHPIFSGEGDAPFYFVHSYHLVPEGKSRALAHTEFGGPVVAAIERGNMIGVQFHPEKSGAAGIRFLERFLAWTPPSQELSQ